MSTTPQPANLAQLKKALIVGQKVRLTNFRFPHLTRETIVTHSQSASFATLNKPEADGGQAIWMQYPKAAQYDAAKQTINDENGAPFLKIELLEADAQLFTTPAPTAPAPIYLAGLESWQFNAVLALARTRKENTDDETAAAIKALQNTPFAFRFVRQLGRETIQVYEKANEANNYII